MSKIQAYGGGVPAASGCPPVESVMCASRNPVGPGEHDAMSERAAFGACVAPGWVHACSRSCVGVRTISLEALADVTVFSSEAHIQAPAQIAEHRAAIALQSGHDFDLPAVREVTAISPRAQSTLSQISAG